MEAIFIKLLNMSISAGWLVLALLLLRPLLRRAPKGITCALWGLVAVRLLLPFSIKSGLSLIPSAETVPQEILYAQTPTVQSGIPALNGTFNPILGEALAPEVGASVNPMQIIAFIAALVWIAGMAAMVLYALISYLLLRRKTQISMEFEKGVFLCDGIDTPFIAGIFRPRIYLPSAMAEEDIPPVLAHERAHLRRKDHLWKPLGFALLAVYWFHPLLWIGYWLLCRDIELACDERVIRSMDDAGKRAYSEALLRCSLPRRNVAACPLAFGEVGIKSRIKSVLSYKKPALWILIAVSLLCIALPILFLTDPPAKTPSSAIGGADGPTAVLVTKSLTLKKVQALAKKGDALGWADFEGYSFIETGSGLYIRQYHIDERFYFSIGGFSRDEKPMYFYLHARNMEESMIDIRYEDVGDFIAGHRNDPIAERLSASWHTCPVGTQEGLEAAIFSMNESKDNFSISNIRYLPFIRLESGQELAQFLSKTKGLMSMERSYSDVDSFQSVLAEYDDAFFKENDLFLAYCTEPMTSIRHTVEYIKKSEGTLHISLQVVDPEEGDTAFEGWLICIRLAKERLKDVEKVSCRIGSAYYPARDTAAAEVSAVYTNGSGRLVLYDNGRFTFTSSPLSSYLGMGYYDIEERRTVLRYDDSDAAVECLHQGDALLIDRQVYKKEE